MNINTILYYILGVLFLLFFILFWVYYFVRPKKEKPKLGDGDVVEKKPGKKEEKKPGWRYHSWRSLLFLAPALGILYLVAKWSQFDGTILQFIMTQKVLRLVFAIAIATYIVTFSVLSTPDWKWYAKLSRKVSGWAIVILLSYLIFNYAGCSLLKLGLTPPDLASLPPVEVCSDGTITIIYKPEYIKQEVNLNLLPGKKYRVYIQSYMKWTNWNKGKRKVHNVQSNGLDWTIRAMEEEFGEKAHIELFPIKDKSTKFAGVIVNVDGYNMWLIHDMTITANYLKFITLNDWQEKSSFMQYKGLMRITLVPQK